MRLVDANLLLYAFHEDHAQHDAALAWLERVLNRPEPVGLPWESLLAFVRIVSNPKVFEQTVGVDQAWHQVEQWLSSPAVWIPQPTQRHQEQLGRFLASGSFTSRYVSDAHLAALAIEHGLILNTCDSDFARFESLRWENPLK